jgi:hypothetical protein
MNPSNHLAFITHSSQAERVVAAWERILPEDDLPQTGVHFTPWGDDTLVTIYAANPEYILAFTEVLAEELPADKYAADTF